MIIYGDSIDRLLVLIQTASARNGEEDATAVKKTLVWVSAYFLLTSYLACYDCADYLTVPLTKTKVLRE